MTAALLVISWVLIASGAAVWIGAAARIAKRGERELQAQVAAAEVTA